MKGLTPTSTIVFVMVLAVIFMIAQFLVSYSIFKIKQDVFTDISRVEQFTFVGSEIKSFANLAAKYSFDQSVYEILKLGGAAKEKNAEYLVNPADGIMFWRKYSQNLAPSQKQLEDSILFKYKEFLGKYLVELKNKQTFIKTMPPLEDSGLLLKLETDSTELATSMKPIELSVSPDLSILVNPSLEKTFNYAIKNIYDFAYANFVAKDSVLEKISSGIDKLGSDNPRCKTVAVGDSCSLPDATPIQNSNCPDWSNKLRKNIEEKISGKESSGYIETKIAANNIRVDTSGACNPSRSATDCDDCCISWSCNGAPERNNPPNECLKCKEKDTKTGECTKWEDVGKYCDQCGTKLIGINCNYDYFGAVKALVNVVDTKDEYFVYSGQSNEWKNPQLNFYVCSGNKGFADLC